MRVTLNNQSQSMDEIGRLERLVLKRLNGYLYIAIDYNRHV